MMQENNKITIYLDGQEIKVDKDKTILEICREHKKDIPTLCHDERLNPYASCWLCIVKVEGARGFVASCATKVTDGMKIISHDEEIYAARKLALELLLSEHYGDCVAPCQLACPAGIDIQGYLAHTANGNYKEALKLIKKNNPLPLSIGRVCTRPCEDACRRNGVDEPVAIDYVKRFVADYDIMDIEHYKPEIKEKTGKKVALIGAGPASLSCAYYLAQEGHQADIYEMLPEGGGMLRYGIPEYRLPKAILDKEIDTIKELGVNFYYNTKFGKDITLEDLREKGYDAIFLGVGVQKGTKMKVEGEDLPQVLDGVEFLRNIGLNKIDKLNGRVIVVGGGNTAIDCARSSVRLGADEVIILYRRTKAEMPAHQMEIEEAEHEGVKIEILRNPVKYSTNNNGKVLAHVIKMELGEPDSSGRRRPVPVENSEYIIEADYIIQAIGLQSDLDFISDNSEIKNLSISKWGTINADEETGATNIPYIFSAGDIVTGAKTVIEAIAGGKKAAISINQYLKDGFIRPKKKAVNVTKGDWRDLPKEFFENFKKSKRNKMPCLEVEERIKSFVEVETGYNSELAENEAARCLECGCQDLFECKLRDYSIKYEAAVDKFIGEIKKHPIDETHPFIVRDPGKCIKCGKCVRLCIDIQGAGAFGYIYRGYNTLIAPDFNSSLTATSCESCGICVSACPVGALTEKVNFKKPGPIAPTNKIKAICNNCSLGCSLEYDMFNDEIIKVSANDSLGINKGRLCARGKFGYAIYENNGYEIVNPSKIKPDTIFVSPFESIETINKMVKYSKENGAKVYSLSLEGKKIKLLFDNYGKLFGEKYEDLLSADLFFNVGSMLKEEFPILGMQIFENVKKYENKKLFQIQLKKDQLSEISEKIFVTEEYGKVLKNINALLANKLNLKDYSEIYSEYKECEFTNLFVENLLKNQNKTISILFNFHTLTLFEMTDLLNFVSILKKAGKTIYLNPLYISGNYIYLAELFMKGDILEFTGLLENNNIIYSINEYVSLFDNVENKYILSAEDRLNNKLLFNGSYLNYAGILQNMGDFENYENLLSIKKINEDKPIIYADEDTKKWNYREYRKLFLTSKVIDEKISYLIK